MTTRNRVWCRTQVNTRGTRYHNSVNQKHTTSSGRKYTTAHGITAIRDGLPQSRQRRLLDVAEIHTTDRKPPWFRVRLSTNQKLQEIKSVVQRHELSTVCEEAHCPNIGECWSHGTATLMLMGSVCTRACRFCSVDTGNPKGWLDHQEPQKSAAAVRRMQLVYVVLTSVDRDDLPDGGAEHFAACINAIHDANPKTTIEALTSDFQGDEDAIRTVVESPLTVFAQNLETVKRLTRKVRDPKAGYEQTLDVLRRAKEFGAIATKSSLMLGLGEMDHELYRAMDDLLAVQVDFLTLGQYSRPTKNHLPVERWVHPEDFERYKEKALAKGFTDVAAGPLVRSSYRADKLVAAHFG